MKANLTVTPRELFQLLSEAMALKDMKLESLTVVDQKENPPSHLMNISRYQAGGGVRGTFNAGSSTSTWAEE